MSAAPARPQAAQIMCSNLAGMGVAHTSGKYAALAAA
jgi:hypothetical protein